MRGNSNILIEKRNSEVFLRPRFTIELEENYQKIIDKFSTSFKDKNCNFLGNIIDGHIFISVYKKEENFWSP
jgi:hypothetical protein